MATVSCLVEATPNEVFSVLSNGWYYSNWVVGTSHMRAVEADWPAVGSRLFHASGVWPANLRDETQVEEMDPDARLVMVARGRPLGQARVELTWVADPAGTRVTLVESPISGPGRWLHNPLNEALLVRRNIEALARLAALVENRTEP
jgi:uncharacterized protein YndB with AHSA1/START domain